MRENEKSTSCICIDVEEWFHILNTPHAPSESDWGSLESRVERGTEILLALLDEFSTKATFFWLGWVAEKHPSLVRRCSDLGHEIASHGHLHIPHYSQSLKQLSEDLVRSKAVLENILGSEVRGYRSPGCLIERTQEWAFDVIAEAGYTYDSSVFPTVFRNGSISPSHYIPHIISTSSGELAEIPISSIRFAGLRWSFFGGGYLRLAPKPLVHWGVRRLHAAGAPLITYIHPREVDLSHPRLPLNPLRKFRCYYNLKSMLPKLRSLCEKYEFVKMSDLATKVLTNNE